VQILTPQKNSPLNLNISIKTIQNFALILKPIEKNIKTFLPNIEKNIILQLFAGESHQVVKITVTYLAAMRHSDMSYLVLT
jgi:hypothetical protein